MSDMNPIERHIKLEPKKRDRFEYRVEDLYSYPPSLDDRLDHLGQMGWELIQIYDYKLFLKRWAA